MLMRLRLGATCLLFAKTLEKQNHGQIKKPSIKNKQSAQGKEKAEKLQT